MAKLKLLSPDAMFLGSSLFSMMTPGDGKLTFGMRESRPTARTQAALDEMVKAKVVSVEPFNDLGGLTYRPLVSFRRPSQSLARRVGKWPITEPIAGRRLLTQEDGNG